MAGVFNERGISDLGRLVYYISLPSLVFTNILTEVSVRVRLPPRHPCSAPTDEALSRRAMQVTWSRLMVLWKLPATAVVHVTCAFLLSKLLNKALRIKGIEARAVCAGLSTLTVVNLLCFNGTS